MIKVEDLSDNNVAFDYLKTIINDQNIYGPLQNAEYRNFVISVDNLKILTDKKDIPLYMEFYKSFYLNRK